MANIIKVRRSATPSAVPTTTALALGELAINTNDGKLFLKKSVLGVETIVDVTASGGGVSTFSAGTTGLTPTVATSGAVVLAGTLAVANGGTGTATPSLVAGSNITITGSFPNQTINGSASGVTSVTGTAPIASSGGATPAISIAQATTTVSGYLTSTDWNTFNNKQVAGSYLTATTGVTTFNGSTTGLTPSTATSGAITLGGTLAIANGGTGAITAPLALTALGAYASSNPSGYTNNTGTVTSVSGTAPISVATGTTTPAITIAQATTSVSGYLSSTDWNTFNGKQAALGFTPYNSTNPAGYTSNTGTVTSVGGTGTVSGLTLTGTVTGSGNLTLGGAITGFATGTGSATGTNTGDQTNVTGSSGSCTGNSATATTATTATNLSGFTNSSSANPIAGADTLTNNGIGYVTGISLFGQTDGALYGQAYSSSWEHQIYGDYRTGQIAIRGKNSGTWQAWRAVLDNTNYTSYAPSLTGSGASGSWGISVTGSSASCTGNAATATTATNVSGGSVNATTGTFSGAITSTGNITAYFSDDRLKTRHGKIENALEKLQTLDGFYYTPNEVAQAFGYEAIQDVGVSAQSVQAIMPEIVVPAPIDENYLTVRYEKLVPLLIEAIKELSEQVNQLKNKG